MVLTKSTSDLYAEYVARMQKIADVKNATAVLQWDQETYLPAKGAAFRGQQMATLSEIAHEWLTADSLGDILKELNGRGDLTGDQQRNVTLSLEDYTKQKKFSPAFIRLLSETSSRSFHAWIKARSANSFDLFKEDLGKLVALKREEAELAGYEQHPYDALADQFEKGCTVGLLDKVFGQVRSPLQDLLDRIRTQPQVDDSFLHQSYPKQQQWDFGMEVIRQMGFDFQAGRQDLSEHPFTTSFNKNDVRITTRIDPMDFSHMTWSCIHETGHALYEQGLPEAYYGLPLGEFASLSIHESQSRLWENHIGRSLGWWKYGYPLLQQTFPAQLKEISLEQFYKGINKAGASLIRTEADEVSYHFHVMIRYELEKSLIEGSLSVSDIPAYWNEQYAAYLGVKVPDDKRGCLQDVHWSHGSFGYFPTYSLGSFYAAQLFVAAENQDNTIQPGIEKGDTAALLAWLRQHVHREGRRYTSEELCRQATGQTLDIKYFMHYLLDKYNKIYNI
ncbi:MAG TPA: carboxypeptidase M32 [Puia sp.]|nr:carboxypeptidase M32 [Puia sp.]